MIIAGLDRDYTHMLKSEEQVVVGGTGMYEARCRICFVAHAEAPTLHDR